MLVLVVGLVLFLGIHSVRMIAPDFRSGVIAQRGEGPWKGVYSLVSLAGFVLLVWGFALARPDAPVFYEPPVWMKHVTALLMLFALIFLTASQIPAGRIKAALGHPMLIAVKTWAVAHLLANGDLASQLLFGAFLVWAVFDFVSVRRRERRGEAVAAVAGPVSNDIIAVVVGVVLYVLFIWKLHYWLFGAVPLDMG